MPITDDGLIEYNMPTEIKDRFTKDMMSDFREKVIETFKTNDIRQGREPFEYEKDTYYGWWMYMEGSSGYVDSFCFICEKYGMNDVLDYYNKLDWYDSDLFDSEFGDLLVHYGLVELGNPEDANPSEDELDTLEEQ